MFPKSFTIAYDLLTNKLSKSDPVLRESLILYVQKEHNCTEMFFNKIQTMLTKAKLIETTMERSADGKMRRTKKLIKVKDVSVMELYELLCGPYPTGEIERLIRPVLKGLSTAK